MTQPAEEGHFRVEPADVAFPGHRGAACLWVLDLNQT